MVGESDLGAMLGGFRDDICEDGDWGLDEGECNSVNESSRVLSDLVACVESSLVVCWDWNVCKTGH